jgi:predicted SprT family Zn-dependent metalloprotease
MGREKIKMSIVNNQIKIWIDKACHANNALSIRNKIKFKFCKSMTRSFGLAYTQSYFIKFSSPLWERASTKDKKQVVIHEVCHIIASHKHGNDIKDHGNEWATCMVKAGVKPDRCHTVDTTGLTKQYVKYAIACACAAVWTSHIKASQVKRKKLKCNKCKHKIILTGQTWRGGQLVVDTGLVT